MKLSLLELKVMPLLVMELSRIKENLEELGDDVSQDSSFSIMGLNVSSLTE